VATAGFEIQYQDAVQLPTSQLAITIESVTLDSIITLWVKHQLGSIWQAAATYDGKQAVVRAMKFFAAGKEIAHRKLQNQSIDTMSLTIDNKKWPER